MSPGHVSRIVVADKIALIRRMLQGIGTLPLDSLASFTADPRMVAAADSYLRRALEAVLDLGRHVLAKGFGRAPAEYGEVARQLGEVGVVEAPLTSRLRAPLPSIPLPAVHVLTPMAFACQGSSLVPHALGQRPTGSTRAPASPPRAS